MTESNKMGSTERTLGTGQKIKRGALALATAVSAELATAPDINAANLLQASGGSQPNRVFVKPDNVQPKITEIQYPQFREVVIVTLPPTDDDPRPTSFYAELLDPIDNQNPNERHVSWFNQGTKIDGLMGEENITKLAGQERKIDFSGNGRSIDCRIVASKMNEEGKIEVEIIWVNQTTHQEERGWVGIEKLQTKEGRGGPEAEDNQPVIKRFDFPGILGLSLQKLDCCRFDASGNLAFDEPNHFTAWVLGETEGYPEEAMDRVIFFHRTNFDNGVEKLKVGQKVIFYYDWAASRQKEGSIEEIEVISAEDQMEVFQKVAKDKELVAFLTCHPKDDPNSPQRLVFITRINNE